MGEFPYYLKHGEIVTDRYYSNLKKEVKPFIEEALKKIEGNRRDFIVEDIDFGKIIGNSICVATDSTDEIVYGQRPRVNRLTRFVKNRQAEPSSFLTVILKKDLKNPNHYVLIDTFIGAKAEPEPQDNNCTARSIPFWNTHALIYDDNMIEKGTETETCPW